MPNIRSSVNAYEKWLRKELGGEIGKALGPRLGEGRCRTDKEKESRNGQRMDEPALRVAQAAAASKTRIRTTHEIYSTGQGRGAIAGNLRQAAPETHWVRHHEPSIADDIGRR